jgi:hypothetical protein
MRTALLLPWLAIICLTSANRKSILFGTSTPIKILEPQEFMSQRLVRPNMTSIPLSQALEPSVDHVRHKTQQLRERDYPVPAALNDGDESWMDDPDAGYFGTSQNDAQASDLFKRRTSIDCGIFRMDCARAGSACNVSTRDYWISISIRSNMDGMMERELSLIGLKIQNACYYQNCVMGGSTIRYVDGGGKRNPQGASENRVDAGTTTNPSSPCRIMPLSQKTYDEWPDWEQDDPNLQLDEWPMAAMSQPEFSTLSPGTVRNSLRCIHHGYNSSEHDSLPR